MKRWIIQKKRFSFSLWLVKNEGLRGIFEGNLLKMHNTTDREITSSILHTRNRCSKVIWGQTKEKCCFYWVLRNPFSVTGNSLLLRTSASFRQQGHGACHFLTHTFPKIKSKCCRAGTLQTGTDRMTDFSSSINPSITQLCVACICNVFLPLDVARYHFIIKAGNINGARTNQLKKLVHSVNKYKKPSKNFKAKQFYI